MPRFDGTGPLGQGPMTGRGEGYCVLVLSSTAEEKVPDGYAGVQGMPVRLGASAFGRFFQSRISSWLTQTVWQGHAFGRGWSRRRGRRLSRW
jgi:uncharacterized protein DUF5320